MQRNTYKRKTGFIGMFQVVLEDDRQLNHTSLRNGSRGFNSGRRRFLFAGKVPLGRAQEVPHGNW